ncbi:unnamed protein product [Allacma fusca]|uniref:Uncharacterized protein n=1 Tax=Allacma fusca TaxID=39272 RepID=A0A8J2KGU3_9HEXA|nr:unnamed protein product [Allacma fusca]
MGKQRADGTIHVTVMTSLPEFKPIICYKVNMKKTTWNEVLSANEISMDPEKYCLKSVDRKKILLPNEKVYSYVSTFQKSWQEYKVVLTAITPTDRKKIAEKGKKKRGGPRPGKSPKKMAYVRKPGTTSAMPNEADFPNPHFDLNYEPGYPEDLFHPNDQGVDEILTRGHQFQEFDDSASQDSQDSQLGLEDIKTAAIARLVKETPNSVMHSVRGEMRNLKQRQNYMKIARYIPLTIALLSHMFKES